MTDEERVVFNKRFRNRRVLCRIDDICLGDFMLHSIELDKIQFIKDDTEYDGSNSVDIVLRDGNWVMHTGNVELNFLEVDEFCDLIKALTVSG